MHLLTLTRASLSDLFVQVRIVWVVAFRPFACNPEAAFDRQGSQVFEHLLSVRLLQLQKFVKFLPQNTIRTVFLRVLLLNREQGTEKFEVVLAIQGVEMVVLVQFLHLNALLGDVLLFLRLHLELLSLGQPLPYLLRGLVGQEAAVEQ